MFPELELRLEILSSFDRTWLERLQIHARYFHALIDQYAESLPLRRIHSVSFLHGNAYVSLAEYDVRIALNMADVRQIAVLFRLLDNAFVEELTIAFGEVNLACTRYLTENAARLQCRINSLYIRKPNAAIDYVMLAFVGAYLKPRVFEIEAYEIRLDEELLEEYALLFTHNALSGCISQLAFYLHEDTRAPVCIIPTLFRLEIVETCAFGLEADPRPWIAEFIRFFKLEARSTHTVPSITLLHWRIGEESPLQHAVDLLGRPHRTDVPTPHCSFIKEQFSAAHLTTPPRSNNASSTAELYVFENRDAKKQLCVYVWTIAQVDRYDNSLHTNFHYAYLLKVVDSV